MSSRLSAARALVRIGWDLVRSCTAPVVLEDELADGDRPGAASIRRTGVDAPVGKGCDRLRIVSWNVHRAYDLGGVAAGLARIDDELGPELLLLQEVPVYAHAPFWELPEVAALFAGKSLLWAPMHRVLAPTPYYPFVASGQLVVSRRPFVAERVIELPTVSRPKLGPDHRFKRNALAVDVATTAGALTVVNAHLENTAPPAGRRLQAERLLASLPAGPVVVAGDLNPLFGPLERVRATFRDAGFDDLFEGGKRRLVPRLDLVFTRGTGAAEARALPIAGSDHRPVAAEIEVAQSM